MSENPDAFGRAIQRILRPLVRALVARGITYPGLSSLLKRHYVRVAEADFQLEGKRVTDSRVSLLTGLQRRDVKALRDSAEDAEGGIPGGGYRSRIIGRWLGDPLFSDGAGAPRPLARSADGDEPSFEALVLSVSQDMHPRTVLDEFIHTGIVTLDAGTGKVSLRVDAYTPSRNEEDLLTYFGANLGDHAAAAVANIGAGPDPAPFFERAVHYNQLTPESLAELDALARNLQMQALQKLNERAHALQQVDRGKAEATGRFRCGAFIYHTGDTRDD